MINCGDGEGNGWSQFEVEFEFEAQQNIICTYYLYMLSFEEKCNISTIGFGICGSH